MSGINFILALAMGITCQLVFTNRSLAAQGSCSGVATSCSSFDDDEDKCTYQNGCHYNAGYGRCSGFAPSCSFLGEWDCRIAGCSWDLSQWKCSGVATSCQSLSSENACEMRSYCSWQDGIGRCSGMATSCVSLTTESGCKAQNGCRWTIR